MKTNLGSRVKMYLLNKIYTVHKFQSSSFIKLKYIYVELETCNFIIKGNKYHIEKRNNLLNKFYLSKHFHQALKTVDGYQL